MKVRSDFVTNSSSSSFILGFKSEEDILNTLANDKTGRDFHQIYNDCLKAEKYTFEEMYEKIKESFIDNVGYEVRRKIGDSRHMSWNALNKFSETEEYEEILNKEIEKRINEIKKISGKSTIFVELEYEDELESDRMPYLDCKVLTISHH
jgi:hypothetical protein